MNEPILPFGERSVMAQRHEDADSLDFFPTPPWATRALFEHVLVTLPDIGVVWEPACGAGHMARVIAEYTGGMPVIATDIADYGFGKHGLDFLDGTDERQSAYCQNANWIITNPPFNRAVDFTLRALELATVGVAMLCRLQWMEGVDRYKRLFEPRPPSAVCPFVERVPMVKGVWDPDASTATSYAWFVWHKKARNAFGHPDLYWIPPGRRSALSRPDDRLRFGPAPDSVPLDVDPQLVTAAAALEG